ncbi:MAG: cobalamin-dependent protein [Oligoflexia bacterium]|nr:cobalamin-dependent protein [Oligoflexia bacterium]
MRLDIILINPGAKKETYQTLAADLVAVEPPFWIAAIAAYLQKKGFSVAIIDANAENLSSEEVATQVQGMKPLIVGVIVYGSQPSASTQNMNIAGKIVRELKEKTGVLVAMGGLHPTALPEQTMREELCDFVIEGEGPYTLEKLLTALKHGDDVCKLAAIPGFAIPGLYYRNSEGHIEHGVPAPLISDLDQVLPLSAWELLPMQKYRAHNWHCFDDIERRSPYAAIYTSLGCPYSCVFCCINALFGKPGIRFRSPSVVVDELEYLHRKYGVRNIKIVDELFVLKESHYFSIVKQIIERKLELNIWAYARVDTINYEHLSLMKKAGINWLALGIESASPLVREGASKKMRIRDIKEVVSQIQNAGIRIIGNYIFGLPDDNYETMQETLAMAIDLKCEFANFYSAMAYPGSKLYQLALDNNWAMPPSWNAYSQHSFDCTPLPTKHLTAAQVLSFRDKAFNQYFSNEKFLKMIEDKFGSQVRQHVTSMTERQLPRKITGV